jgi:hypothetical protein
VVFYGNSTTPAIKFAPSLQWAAKKMFFLLQRPFSSIGSYMKKFKA